APKGLRSFAHQLGVFHGRRSQRYPVCPGKQQLPHLLYGTDAPAYGEGDGQLVRDTSHEVDQRPALLLRRGDIEETDLIRAVAVIHARSLHRIASILEIPEPDPLDDPSALDVQARDDPTGPGGAAVDPARSRGVGRVRETRHLRSGHGGKVSEEAQTNLAA